MPFTTLRPRVLREGRAVPIESIARRGVLGRLVRGTSSHDRRELLTGPIRGELLGADHLAERARAPSGSRPAAPDGGGAPPSSPDSTPPAGCSTTPTRASPPRWRATPTS